MTISVLLVDNHTIFRESVRWLLEATTDFSIVGEAGGGLDALAMAERLHPDVVVMDCVMPEISGIEVTLRLCKSQQNTHVVIMSLYDDENYVVKAFQNGASGYILKEDIVAHLAEAVTAAAARQLFFSSSIRKRIPFLELPDLAVKGE
jgi:DNA-binding NarL/FixJ family response regulator